MPRTPLAQKLCEMFSVVEDARRRKVAPEQVRQERAQAFRRRDFLKAAGAAAATLPFPLAAASSPRIAIVGAGLAGLTCAYRLRQAGYAAQVWEASARVGGRCWTRRGDFAEGQIAEHGGELIDTGHRAIRKLASELGLALDDLSAAEQKGTGETYYFYGHSYSVADATEQMNAIWPKLRSDLKAAGYPTLYNSYTSRGWQLDHMSITDWINESVPGGASSWFGRLLDVAYTIEFGAGCDDQSSLNLLYLLAYGSPSKFSAFGASDERYHVRGGNDQIASRLSAALMGQIQFGKTLIAIKQNSDGTYTLTFSGPGPNTKVDADEVVLTIPFSILRQSVDYSQAGFSAVKRTAIQELGMGMNCKLHLQFGRRIWQDQGNNGSTYADTGYQNTWEVTRAQAGTSGILVDYTGAGVAAGQNKPLSKLAPQFLNQIEPVVPGLTAQWNGRATLDYWPGNPLTRGSYSYWRVGQYTKFAGAEGQAEGKCHFAGEHTSIDYQGYLNGAVDSGERAAAEILAEIS
jgi:monoamine oxidase